MAISATVEYAAFIGLDWGSEKHSVAIQAVGFNEVLVYSITQTPEDLHRWILQLEDKFGGKPVAIAIEQTKGAVIHALLAYSFVHVFRINPKSLADYRKAFSQGGAKDDPSDAQLLLEFVTLHRHRIKPWVPDDVQTRTMQRLVEFRRDTVNRRTAIKNQITQVLNEYFPQALEWAGDLDTAMACDFLSNWPTLEKVKKTKPEKIRAFYRNHGCRRSELADKRMMSMHTATSLTNDPAVIVCSVAILETLIPLMRALIEGISRLDEEIETLFHAHPDMPIFDSFPGAGCALAPRLLAAFGSDRTRFESAVEIQNYSGIAPVTERSGKHEWVHRRFACPKFLRQTFHEFAGQSIHRSAWARAYYDMQRDKGKEHHAAVRSLAFKWIRIVFRCWKDKTIYDEETYLKSLRNKEAKLLNFLEQAA
jgi:transposase